MPDDTKPDDTKPDDAKEALAAACLAAQMPRRQALARILQFGGAGAALAACDRSADARLAALAEQCAALELQVLGYHQPSFPTSLQHIPDPPVALFARGDPAWLSKPSVAIVGARRASRAGVEIAAGLGREIALAGVPVVSGLALGIDAAAHRGALDAGTQPAPVVAVLGSGLAAVYPRSNQRLAQRIVAAGGVLVSEYLPSQPPARHQFPERNRLISGLSRGVVLVEAGARSGSLITARLALEQGREVLAVPGSIAPGTSEGCHRLLKQGAALVEGVADVWETLAFAPLQCACAPVATIAAELAPVLAAVAGEVTSVDEIARATKLPIAVVSARLTALELEGFVVQERGGYIRRPFKPVKA